MDKASGGGSTLAGMDVTRTYEMRCTRCDYTFQRSTVRVFEPGDVSWFNTEQHTNPATGHKCPGVGTPAECVRVVDGG